MAAFHPEYEYITNTRLIANGALTICAKSDEDGANDTGCGVAIDKSADQEGKISKTFRMVATIWNVDECLTPVSITSDTSHTTPSASASGGASGSTDLPYSPNAIAASDTGRGEADGRRDPARHEADGRVIGAA